MAVINTCATSTTMQQIPIYFKSDFKLFIRTEAGFAVPFKFEFYTNMPSRPYIAKYDGHKYHNCELLEDGRLCIAFDDHGFGLGKLMIRQSYYLNDADYASEICDRVIAPQPVVNIDDNLLRSEIVLALSGDDTIEFTSQLPPYYQAGLTPEEHQALIDETNAAHEAAALANEEAEKAKEAARKADEAREQITTTYNEKVAALESDYTQKKAALDADYAQAKSALAADYAEVKGGLQSDYEAKKQALDADYAAKKSALEADYTSVKSALAASYAEAINGINQRMSAIEAQYVTDKAAWQAEVDAIIAKMQQDFEAAEAQRETRVNTAVQSANTATANANQKATEAGKVNAVLNGDNLTVTDRNGQSVTRNVRGPKGDSVTMFPAVTIFGQPRIQETQMSEFTAQNYAQFPFLVDFAGRHWRLDCAITTGADVSQQHNVFDSAFGLAFAFSGGKFVLAMSSNGTSWNLGATSGTHSILANTTYYIRITWDGSRYVLAYSTDKVNWTNDITVASAESLASKQIIIGKSLDNAHIFNGSINFAEARLTIANVIVWEGMEEVGTATRMAIDMSNIDEAGKQKVNGIVKEGEVGKKTERNTAVLGPYAGRAPIVLTLEENGKAINRAGVKVNKSGWAICSFVGQKGDVYSFDPGVMDNDVCIFSEEIVKKEYRPIEYKYAYDAEGLPTKATATYNGAIHSYTFTYEKDAEGHVVSETITDDQTGEVLNALPYQYQSVIGTYHPLTILNATAELPLDHHCRLISHFQGEGTIRVTVSFNVASADMNLLVFRDGLIANLANQLGTIFQMISETNKALSIIENNVESLSAAFSNSVSNSMDDSALPTLCGQPPILFGAGTPTEAVVPMNWKQFDPETGDGYNWNGQPSAIGQQYINTSATTGGRYIAVPSADGGLTWKNM